MIGRLRHLVRSALPGRTGNTETAPRVNAPRTGRRRPGSEADRRIEAARRRLKASIPPPPED